MEPFEIAADRDRLGEEAAVVQLEDRHATEGVPCPVRGREVLAAAEIDRHRLGCGNALLLQEDLDAAGVGRG